MNENLIELEHINKIESGNIILKDVTFNIKKGSFVSIIGPSGSGKTSLAKIILGIDKNFTGSIKKANNLKIGFVPQKIILNENLPITCKEYIKILSQNNINIEDLINQFKEFNLSEALLNQDIKNLSGGQLQRLNLIATLLLKPNFLILDEPTQGLDVQNQTIMYEIISNYYKQNNNSTILMISHDLNNVFVNSTDVVCLNTHICCMGKPNDIAESKEYGELFNKYTLPYSHDKCHDHDH
jgi:zinc transport system ATP-binding protein